MHFFEPERLFFRLDVAVQIAQPLADVLTFITSVPFLVRFFAQLPRQDRE